MKIGVIGAGNWGKNIVKTLAELEVLGGIVDYSEDNRAKVSEFGQTFDHEDPLLTNPEIHGIAIATPGHTHFEVAKKCLLAGKDVFVEKPMVLSSAQGDELVRLAAEHGRVLMVGHLLIYQPAITFIKKAISDGMIGKLASLHQERLNLGRARAVENVLWSIGVHDIAVLLYLIGEAPTSVSAFGQKVLQPSIDDDVYVHMGFGTGDVLAHVHSSWLWPVLRRCLTVVGSEGMLVYDELAQNVTLHKKSIDESLASINLGEEIVFEGAGKPLTLEMEHFIHCIATRETPISDGKSAVEVLRVIESAGLEEDAVSADSQANVTEAFV